MAGTSNSLREYVVEAPSIKSFERRLNKFWGDQLIRFDHASQIITTCIREKLNRQRFGHRGHVDLRSETAYGYIRKYG